MSADVFGTEAQRRRVLEAWAASPARLLEDSNAEEDLVRGGYRDRLIVELAQNAADAAIAAGVPGRLLLRLAEAEASGTHATDTAQLQPTLFAANTGAQLDANAVIALSTLRASSKTDQQSDLPVSVGRFGVGFAAVLAVSDNPRIANSHAGVSWSRNATANAVDELAQNSSEIADIASRRGTELPVLRLPFATPGFVQESPAMQPWVGYDTVVALPLRDSAASVLVLRLLDGVDDGLLLALPGLVEIDVQTPTAHWRLERSQSVDSSSDTEFVESVEIVEIVRTGDRGEGATRWRRYQATGRHEPETLADRGVQERANPQWSVSVAIPISSAGAPLPLPPSMSQVFHAPTPTDDQVSLPALFTASFALDPSRRRIAPGRSTDALIDALAQCYVRSLVHLIDEGLTSADVLALLPPTWGQGELDAALLTAISAGLRRTALIPAADGARLLVPSDAVSIAGLAAPTGDSLRSLAAVLPGLAQPPWWRPEFASLGMRALPVADFVDELYGLHLPTSAWHDIYDGLQGADRDALSGLPVPLHDGRVARGARELLMVEATTSLPESVDLLGLRVVDPAAVHPLLERLGARWATPVTLLDAARAAVANDVDGELEDVVLDLVEAAGITAAELPWLAELLIEDDAGHLTPANELYVRADLDPDRAVSRYLVDPPLTASQRPLASWLAIGVNLGLPVRRLTDVLVDELLDFDEVSGVDLGSLAGLQEWLDTITEITDREDTSGGAPTVISEFVALGDLDLVDDTHWAAVLNQVSNDEVAREALRSPTWVILGDGRRVRVPSLTPWWLRRNVVIDDVAVDQCCASDADRVVRALSQPLPASCAPEVAAMMGLPTTVSDLSSSWLLDRLADASVSLASDDLHEVYRELTRRWTTAGAAREEPPAPRHIRVGHGGHSLVVPADQVQVVASPALLPWVNAWALAGSAALADLLDVDMVEPPDDPVGGSPEDIPPQMRELLLNAPTHYLAYDVLRVGDREVSWWVDLGGAVHASTMDGLAAGLAWSTGHWGLRHALAAAGDESGGQAIAEYAFDVDSE